MQLRGNLAARTVAKFHKASAVHSSSLRPPQPPPTAQMLPATATAAGPGARLLPCRPVPGAGLHAAARAAVLRPRLPPPPRRRRGGPAPVAPPRRGAAAQPPDHGRRPPGADRQDRGAAPVAPPPRVPPHLGCWPAPRRRAQPVHR
jgi:hypothetical protein